MGQHDRARFGASGPGAVGPSPMSPKSAEREPLCEHVAPCRRQECLQPRDAQDQGRALRITWLRTSGFFLSLRWL